MRLPLPRGFHLMLLILAGITVRAGAQNTLLEDVHAVPAPRQDYGYRDLPGSIIELKDGRLLLAYTSRLADGSASGGIGAKYSADQGKTWGEEFMLVPAPPVRDKDRYCLPSFLRLANGQILLSYIYTAMTMPLYGQNYYRRSADDGQTWGDQLIVNPEWGYSIMHNDKLLQLSTGRILAPLEYQKATSGDDHAGYVTYTAFSDDNGYRWSRSANDVNMLPIEAQEAQVVELKDGRLMMLMRTYSQYIARAYSDDQGTTWSEGELVKALPLPPHTTSAFNIKRVPGTGDLLLLRCTGGPKEPRTWRTPFVSVLSKDDGQTWENERIIAGDPEEDYGYPGLTFVGDRALIAYHWRDGLHVARIGLDWFYAE